MRVQASVAAPRARLRQAESSRLPGWLQECWPVALACLAAVAVFWPCLRFGFAMDDFALIEAGRAPLRVGIPAHFVPRPGIHYRPLAQYGYFWLADWLFGYQPLPFHVANLLLHLGNVVLVARLLRRFTRERLAAGLATLFFAVHSALFLVIAWTALAGEAIPLLFILLALDCYARYIASERAAMPRRAYGWLALTVVATIAAMLSKQVAIVLPVVLLFYGVLFGAWGRRPLAIVRRPDTLALLALLAAYFGLVMRVSGPHASGPYALAFDARVLRTAATYALWTLDLARLRASYPPVALAVAWLGGLALLAFALWRRDRLLLFGLGWYIAFLAPVLLLPEHLFHYYLYAPLFGAALVVGRLAELALAAIRPRTTRLLAVAVVAVVLVAANGAGVVTELDGNPTLAQVAQAARALAVLRREHPTLPPGATIEFVAPAEHIYYVLGYGAAVRLAYPAQPPQVAFAGILPASPGSGPVYRYRWTGETIVAAP